MKKKLSEMTLEELWQLFPIYLTEHKECWEKWYEEEKKFLLQSLADTQIMRINHIGSTAVAAIWAKPIIDILVETPQSADWEKIENTLVKSGYIVMSKASDRISLNKGYTEEGFTEKVFHLHLRRAGDNDELYFKDYLIDNSVVAKEYEKMKFNLWEKYEHNRDAYTASKTEFIKKYTQKAKELYHGRYD